MTKRDFEWTEEREKLLVERLSLGHTQADIAVSFNINYQEVIRQVARMRKRNVSGMPIGQQDIMPDCLALKNQAGSPMPKGEFITEPAKRFKTCQYLDDPQKRDFCKKKTIPGKSYCEDHQELCYKKREPKDKRGIFVLPVVPGM